MRRAKRGLVPVCSFLVAATSVQCGQAGDIAENNPIVFAAAPERG